MANTNILGEAALKEIEARQPRFRYGVAGGEIALSLAERDALCATVRALQARLSAFDATERLSPKGDKSMTKNYDDFRAGMLRAAEIARNEFKQAPDAAKGQDCIWMGGYESACDHLCTVIAQAAVIDCVPVAGQPSPDWHYHISLLLPDEAVSDEALSKIYGVVQLELNHAQSQLAAAEQERNSIAEARDQLSAALSVRDAQLAVVTKERDQAYEEGADFAIERVQQEYLRGKSDFRTRAAQLCKEKAAECRQTAEGNLARDSWIDRAELAEEIARSLEQL